VLFAVGVALPDRAGTILVGAAGITTLATAYVDGFAFIFDAFSGQSGTAWGWELAALLQGLALLAYACSRLEPGPGYLAFFALAFFTLSAAYGLGGEGSYDEQGSDLTGWPLAIGLATLVALAWPLSRRRS
jgi:hypothetical protein